MTVHLKDMDIKQILAFFLIFLGTFWISASGYAQLESYKDQIDPHCKIDDNRVIELEDPIYNTPLRSNASYKLSGLENLIGFLPAKGHEDTYNQLVLAGNYKKAGSEKRFPFLTKITRDGKILWGLHDNSKFHKTALNLHLSPSGYTIIGNMSKSRTQNGFYFSRYDESGKLEQEVPFFQPGTYLKARDSILTHDSDGYLIAADKVAFEKDGKQWSSALYRMDMNGFSPWDNQYNGGQNSTFHHIHKMPNGRYILSGQIEQDDKRIAGWLFYTNKVGKDGWQQTYIRGLSSVIQKVIPTRTGGFITMGEIESHNSPVKTAWIMRLNSQAQPVWQRYFKGLYKFTANDVKRDENGVISLLLTATPQKGAGEKKTHMRLITLTPRGELLNIESFSNADHAEGVALQTDQKGNRFILALKKFIAPAEVARKTGEISINEGWLFSIAPHEAFIDPCGLTP